MPVPTEVEGLVSEELAAFIAPLLDIPDSNMAATLGFVRGRILDVARAQGTEPLRTGVGDGESLIAEIDALIEEFGEDAPAADFVAVKAGEDLSRFIEAVLDMSEADIVPTLGGIRTAIADGWVARLAGEGVIEDDEEQSLLAEIESLIDRYGEDSPAEDVLRFE